MANSRQDDLVYRRGLVMGLTMAEVMVLVLFALLLLIGFQARRLSEVNVTRDQLVKLAKAFGVEPQAIPEEFDRLESAMAFAKAVVDQEGVAPLTAESVAEAADVYKLGQDVKARFGPNTVGQKSIEAAKGFVKTAAAAFEGKRRNFGTSAMWASAAASAQLKDEGTGLVYPPCAIGADEKPAYLFTARLFDTYVILEDRDLSTVQGLDAFPLLKPIVRSVPVGPGAFLDQTRALFEWSKSKNCRFFVWIDDVTGVAEKKLYKERLRTVGQHFYYFEPNDSVQGRIVSR